MLTQFEMNGYLWRVVNVPSNSPYLISRDNVLTVATTDPDTMCIYLSDRLRGDFKKRVVAHEMGHACCFSFGLLDEIRECCYPSKVIQMEEFVCNFVADYGERIFMLTYQIMGDEALDMIPWCLERLVA